jgi:hypothetical protein
MLKFFLSLLVFGGLACEINVQVGAGEGVWVSSLNVPAEGVVRFVVSGLPIGNLVNVTVALSDGRASSSTFVSDINGRVDTASFAPVGGSYVGFADGRALFYMMSGGTQEDRVCQNSPSLASFSPSSGTLQGKVIVHDGLCHASFDYVEYNNVSMKNVTTTGSVGFLFWPTSVALKDVTRAVLWFGGSEGGLLHPKFGALLSQKLNAAVLNVAYFGCPYISPSLTNISLEYFFSSLDLLTDECPLAQSFGVWGWSLGSQAAALVSAHYRGRKPIGATVLGVPSYVAWGADSSGGASWTLRGVAVSSLPLPDFGPSCFVNVGSSEYQILIVRQCYLSAVLKGDSFYNGSSVLPFEQIFNPLLVVSGTSDMIWPSDVFANMIVARRSRVNLSTVSLQYCGAGHAVCTPPTATWPGLSVVNATLAFSLGGTGMAESFGTRNSFEQIVEFLGKNLMNSKI